MSQRRCTLSTMLIFSSVPNVNDLRGENMNETLFSEIAKGEVQNLEKLIQKGLFQSSDFENAVLETANVLLSLHQAIQQTKGEK